jgi:hypothetical protein
MRDTNQIIDEKKFKDTVTYQVLDILGKLLAPATLLSLISEISGVPRTIYIIVALAIFCVSAIILFGRRYFERLMLILLGISVVTLSAVLAWQYYKINKDPWVKWNSEINNALNDCKDDVCIAEKISLNPAPTNLETNTPSNKLDKDIRIGNILLRNDKVADMLDRNFGIKKQSFLGTGLAHPTGEKEYFSARIPEYLVPNYQESSKDLITCSLIQDKKEWIFEKE